MLKLNEMKNNSNILAGLEIGEHKLDYANLIDFINENIDLTKTDFLLIYTKPVNIPDRLWHEWASFFRDKGLF